MLQSGMSKPGEDKIQSSNVNLLLIITFDLFFSAGLSILLFALYVFKQQDDFVIKSKIDETGLRLILTEPASAAFGRRCVVDECLKLDTLAPIV